MEVCLKDVAFLADGFSNLSPSNERRLRTGSQEKTLKGNNASGVSIVSMDEVDRLMTAKQEVVYNLFNWPMLPNPKLIVLAVPNTIEPPGACYGMKIAELTTGHFFDGVLTVGAYTI